VRGPNYIGYVLAEMIKRVNNLEPKIIFKSTDLLQSNISNTNKANGKLFKADVDNGLFVNVKSIRKDSANMEWYVRTY
jgi:hypothetical protein